MEAVVAASITGLLALAGTWLTVRQSRRASLRQHEEQNSSLVSILENQVKFMEHNETLGGRFDSLELKVADLKESHDVLFGLVAEVDAKVTKPSRVRKSDSLREVV